MITRRPFLIIVLSAIAALHSPSVAQTPIQLTAASNVQDGEIHDVATQYDSTSNPADKRAWVAQGKVRAALRLIDHLRLAQEDRTFTGASPVGGPLIPEWVIRVEVDDVNGYLYTLTPQAVYRETITAPHSPANPGDLRYKLFSTFIPVPAANATDHESLEDVKLIPSSDKILLLTSWRPIIMISNASTFDYMPLVSGENSGQSQELYQFLKNNTFWNSGNSAQGLFDKLKLMQLKIATVAIDSSGKTIAYILAAAKKYPYSGRLSIVHGYCKALIQCDLDAVNGFANPHFDADPTGQVGYAYWDPYSIYTGPGATLADAEDLRSFNAYEMVARTTGSQSELFVACGKSRHLVHLHLSFAPGVATEFATINPDSTQHLFEMHADPANQNLLYIHGSSRFFTLDVSAGAPVQGVVNDESFFAGGYGDSQLCLVAKPTGGVAKTVWFVGSFQLDHLVKIYHVDTVGAPGIFHELGFLWRCDGAVALDSNNVYVPTWGGLQHYQRDSGTWQMKGYQPAQIGPAGATLQSITEAIAIGSYPGGNSVFVTGNFLDPYTVLGQTISRTGFIEYQLDSSHDPMLPTFFEVDVTPLGWTVPTMAPNTIGSLAIEYLSFGQDNYVVFTVDRLVSGARDTGLFAYKRTGSTWAYSGAGAFLHPQYSVSGPANAISFGTMSTGAPAAFVAGDFGVASYDMTGIATAGIRPRTMHSPGGTRSLVVAGSRIIVFYDWNPGTGGAIADIYDWDTTSGGFNTTPVVSVPLDPLLQALEPNSVWESSNIARYDPISAASGHVYVCLRTKLRRLLYDAATPALSYDAILNASIVGDLQDARIYSFVETLGQPPIKRFLLAKDSEGFLWSTPL
jgi:hypothetical protein